MSAVEFDLQDTARQLPQLRDFYQQTLLQDVIPFWFPHCKDTEHGGFLHCLDADGSVVDTDKSIWAQGRITWMLLTLHNTMRADSNWLAWGQQGIDFLWQHGFDSDGRMFFHVARDGKPIRKRRYAYSEAFAAIACGALYKATGLELWQHRAVKLFQQFKRWNFTPGLMPSKFCDTRPLIGIGPRMIALVTAQTLRSDLQSSENWNAYIDQMIDQIERWFVKDDLQLVMETVGEQGEVVDHFDARLLNPGHAIEAAWFIIEEGRFRGEQRLVQLGCKILDYSWRVGWDEQFGGLYYFRDALGRPVQEYWHDMKFWWPHDEAIIATLSAFLATGDAKYAQWHRQVHQWSFSHFADTQHGEWWGYLHRDGRVSTTLKGNMWKSFFHHPRMLWKCWQLLSDL